MLVQFSVAVGLIVATIVIQALFMSTGLRTFKRIEHNRPTVIARNPTIATVIWIVFLIIPIVLDVTMWATFYYAQASLPNFEESLYFSTVTFTTVGYGDIVLGKEWRLLARLSQLREGIADFSVKRTGKSESIQGVKNSKRL
jgi:drug/metabolite transporter (DMT)-like permease